MPKQYEAMRDKFAKEMPLKEAKTRAAKFYNANRGSKRPVTGKHKKGTKHG
jgi:hypothetical protein